MDKAYEQIDNLQQMNREYAETIAELQAELDKAEAAAESASDTDKLVELGGRVMMMAQANAAKPTGG